MQLWGTTIIFLLATKLTPLLCMNDPKITLLPSFAQPSAPDYEHLSSAYTVDTQFPAYNPYIHLASNKSQNEPSCCTKAILYPCSVITCCVYGIIHKLTCCTSKK